MDEFRSTESMMTCWRKKDASSLVKERAVLGFCVLLNVIRETDNCTFKGTEVFPRVLSLRCTYTRTIPEDKVLNFMGFGNASFWELALKSKLYHNVVF